MPKEIIKPIMVCQYYTYGDQEIDLLDLMAYTPIAVFP